MHVAVHTIIALEHLPPCINKGGFESWHDTLEDSNRTTGVDSLR